MKIVCNKCGNSSNFIGGDFSEMCYCLDCLNEFPKNPERYDSITIELPTFVFDEDMNLVDIIPREN